MYRFDVEDVINCICWTELLPINDYKYAGFHSIQLNPKLEL